MLLEGLEILCIGMGVVFCFLVVMIYTMQLSSTVITKFFPEEVVPVVQAVASAGNDKAKIAAAIAIARSRKA